MNRSDERNKVLGVLKTGLLICVLMLVVLAAAYINAWLSQPDRAAEDQVASNARPLPERRNIVLTRAADYPAPPGIDLVHSLDAALALCRRRRETRAFIIGGEALYAEALPIADEMFITHVVPDAPLTGDAFFPPWNEDEWDRVGPVEPGYPAAVRYRRGK